MGESVLREIAAKFGIEFDDSKLVKGQKTITAGIGLLQNLAAAIAGAEIVRGVSEWANSFQEAGSRLRDTADQLGVTTTELQELTHAGSLAGVSAEGMAAAMGKLTTELGAVRGGPAEQALSRLGLRARDAQGNLLSVPDLMSDIAHQMGTIQDPATRANIATQLFGRAGRTLLPILHDGADGLEALRGEVEALGGGINEEAVNNADAYGDSLMRWKLASDSVRSVTANALLPTLTRFVTWMTEGAAAIARITRGTHVAQIALVAVGLAAAQAGNKIFFSWVRALIPFAPIILAVGALVLIIDDLWGLITGGDSLIGRWLDSFYGVGTARHVVLALKDAWEGLQLFLTSVAGPFLANMWNQAIAKIQEFWGFLTGLTTAIGVGFLSAWNSVDEAFGGALGRMTERLRAWLAPVGRILQQVGRLMAAPINAVAGFGRDIVHDWQEILTPAAAAVPAHAGAGNTVIHRNVGPTTIHLTGVENPAENARRIRRELDARESVQNDANHRLRPQGS